MMQTYPNQPYTPYDYNAQNPYLSGYRNYGNYSPYNSIPGNQQQPVTAQTAPMSVPQQTNNNIQFVLVPSREVAEQAIAEKGQTLYMLIQNEPEICAKSADSFGLQTKRYFKLLEFNPNEEKQQAQQVNITGDYIPRSEFNQFVAAVSAEIENLKNAPVQNVQQPVTKPTNNSSKKPAQKDDTNDK